MPAVTYKDIRDRVREHFRDDGGTMFDDGWLDFFIGEGQREYVFLTSCLRSSAPVAATASGVIPLPADCYFPLGFVTNNGEELPIVSWRRLCGKVRGSDFRATNGSHPLAAVFDFDSYGLFRLYPKVTAMAGQDIGTINYCRFPGQDIEIADTEAIVDYVLWQMYTLAGNDSAGVHYRKFQGAVSRFNAGGGRIRAYTTRGRFF